MALDLSKLELALQSFHEAVELFYQRERETEIRDALRDSVIQRFEYSYELAWKMLQRWLRINASPEEAEPASKKDLFRLAARKGLIADPQHWFTYIEARNASVHTYNATSAEKVLQAALAFEPDAQFLLGQLKARND